MITAYIPARQSSLRSVNIGLAGCRLGKRLIYFSLGLPGRLAEWCDAVLAYLAGRLPGDVIVATWPPLTKMLGYDEITPVLDQVAISLIETSATRLVMGARQPDERLRAALGATNARFVVALDDPRSAVADILGNTNGDLRAVTRAVANSCPLVMQCASSPGAITIRGYQADPDAVGAVAAIARHFELTLDDGEAQHVVDELAGRGLSYAPGSPDGGPAQSPAARHKMVEGVLGAYAKHFAGDDLGAIIWQRELFIVNGDSGSGLADALDVRGGMRILIFGPYIHLPAGSWTARVFLGFSPEAAGHTFLVDAYSGGQLGSTSFQPERAGVYTVDINFSLDEPSGQGVEIRVWVWSEYARGQLAFGHVILRPLAMRQPESITGSQDDFRTVLDL
jgi:hypothetical protein